MSLGRAAILPAPACESVRRWNTRRQNDGAPRVDLFRFVKTGEFQKSLGVAKNILTVRLNKLVDDGVLAKVPASDGSAFQEYTLTEKGREYAKDALARSTYVGPAPVPIEQYNRIVTAQSGENPLLGVDDLRQGLAHLVISDDILHKLGPAVNSGR